ncbi:Pre-mRNA-splicing factor sap61 [Teratosphaeriaceae sp. CCFEE 6253]|nr:Pre-mRNA-splicing factor sap61 [Teratosphaeriaceae sp. CCFEE 6253]
MLLDELRYAHEELERLEQAIADRVLEEPKHIRNRQFRDLEISNFLSRIATQSERALHIYNDEQEARTAEVQSISTGDTFEEFYKQLAGIKDFHKRYPNEPVENLERAYKKVEDGGPGFAGNIDSMFTGEEAYGRFFDLTTLHEEYLNLPGVRGGKKLTYLQYLDVFDKFTPPSCNISRQDKMTDQYFSYVGTLAQYLESFIRRTKPLEDLDKLFASFDVEFDALWEENTVSGWEPQKAAQTKAGAIKTEGTGNGAWCAECEREFKNENVYRSHLTGKKHIKNAESRQQRASNGDVEMSNGSVKLPSTSMARLKERAVAEREHRVHKLAASMTTERSDTRVNVERKAGMTDRERQQELAALYDDDDLAMNAPANADAEDADGDEKLYNPLKLPLAWDGKPIPFWLFKLHGLGVEFPCEVCGNFVYMGRRAFDKHFSEARHVHGLKCLGITQQAGLFSQITGIEEAMRLWEKVQRDKAEGELRRGGGGVEEMEDAAGQVMPRRVWEDLKKAGLL